MRDFELKTRIKALGFLAVLSILAIGGVFVLEVKEDLPRAITFVALLLSGVVSLKQISGLK